ncbi:MAG: DPP IV N-terminal domain-containing protein, partial [Parvularculaceae bacterium]
IVEREQRDFLPRWAPDGSHLVFTSVVDGAHVIMRVNPDGSDLTQITPSPEAAGDPDYSPDGATILYFTDEPKPRDLYLRDVSTGETTQLTDTPDFDEMTARWAPDGRSIVFVGKDHADGAESDIWIIDSETGKKRNLTQTDSVGEFHPDWSHDGKRVVYIRVADGAFDVAVRDITTNEEKIVASGNGFAVLSPSFSSSDVAIGFTRTDFAEQGEGMPAIISVSLKTGTETVLAKGLYPSQMKKSE